MDKALMDENLLPVELHWKEVREGYRGNHLNVKLRPEMLKEGGTGVLRYLSRKKEANSHPINMICDRDFCLEVLKRKLSPLSGEEKEDVVQLLDEVLDSLWEEREVV